MCRWRKNAPWWTTTRPRWARSNSSAALRRPDLKSQTEAKKCEHHSHPAVVQPNKSALLKRLNRIEGQARGVAKMVEEDRYCIDILTQIAAIQSALDALSMQLLPSHTNGCVRSAIRSGNGEAAIDELMTVVKRFGR